MVVEEVLEEVDSEAVLGSGVLLVRDSVMVVDGDEVETVDEVAAEVALDAEALELDVQDARLATVDGVPTVITISSRKMPKASVYTVPALHLTLMLKTTVFSLNCSPVAVVSSQTSAS